MNLTKHDVLKQYFGYDDFRAGQEQIIDAICTGQDVLAVMPTGAGKSICFQVPALIFEGLTLVISPLISLMKDQVMSLVDTNIRAAYINSSLSTYQIRKLLENAQHGQYDLLYIAPERLDSEDFIDMANSLRIAHIAIDEAHCASQWGQDFRPSYLSIIKFVDSLLNRPNISAFTATATPEVGDDICKILKLKNPFRLTSGFDRPNLYFSVKHSPDKDNSLIEILKTHPEQNGIIYCSTRKAVEQTHSLLIAHDYHATRYHAGLSDVERRTNQDDFIYDNKPIIVATNAFGMGIDKSNVSFVVHYNMPKDIESYYQEAGRAGRDGSPADCILLFSEKDVMTSRFLIDQSSDGGNLSQTKQEQLKSLGHKRLKEMVFYSKTTQCLRNYILNYFGEKIDDNCMHCSNCHMDTKSHDYTIEAQKILSCVYRTNQRFGVNVIIDILRGSKKKKLLSWKLDQQSTYGIMAKESSQHVRQIIDQMLILNYIAMTNSEFPTLSLTKLSYKILKSKQNVILNIAPPIIKQKTNMPKQITDSVQVYDKALFAELKALRTEIAKNQNVPAYIVFSDKTLIDMAIKYPVNSQAFLAVSGVGQAKLERYGHAFTHLIQSYIDKNNITYYKN